MLGSYQVKILGKPCVAAACVDNTLAVVWCYVTIMGLGAAIASKFLLPMIAKLLA